jgi:hypothetical protein
MRVASLDCHATAPRRNRARSVAAGLVLLVAAGCGPKDMTHGDVSGRVTVDGAPAATGAVTFMPADGNSATSGGKIVDGSYSVKASVGVAKVEIRVPKVVGSRKLYDTPDSPEQPLMEESLPKKFNDDTELTFDVKPGDNAHDFDLTTR